MEQVTHKDTCAPGGTTNWNRQYAYNTNKPNNYLQSTHSGTPPGSPEYTYDAHGNMLTMPHLSSLNWDFADQLKSTDKTDETTHYVYSGGQPVRKVVLNTSGTTDKIKYERIYLGAYELYRSYDVAEELDIERATHHIMDDSRKVAMLEAKTTDGGTEVSTPATITRYQYTNHLDTASLELDENAEILSYEEYHPFGSTSYQLHTNDVTISLKRYRYVHKERDEETGLYYYGARYYAGWLCRFVSVDPQKDEYAFQNSYAYAVNSPINLTDVNGEGPGGGETPVTHTVQSGDTYSQLALDYGVSVDSLRTWNGYEDTQIPIGANLVVSDPTVITGLGSSANNNPNNTSKSFGSQRALQGVPLGPPISPAEIPFEFPVEIPDSDPDSPGSPGLEDIPQLFRVPLAAVLTVILVLLPKEIGPEPRYDYRPEFDPELYPWPPPEETRTQRFELFYRAMSEEEYTATGGYLADLNTSGEGPHVTTDLTYLTSNKSFINKPNPISNGSYDVIVQYKIPISQGSIKLNTTPYLVVTDGTSQAATYQAARNTGLWYKKTEGNRGTAYGFPGISAAFHFNPYIVGPPQVIKRRIPGTKLFE